MFVHLHSCFSLRYGTIRPERLVQLLEENGYTMAALADYHSTFALFDFIRAGRKAGLHTVAGISFRQTAGPVFHALAHHRKGFAQLAAYLSQTEASCSDPLWSDLAAMEGVSLVLPLAFFLRLDKEERQLILNNEQLMLGVRPEDLPGLGPALRPLLRQRGLISYPVVFEGEEGYQLHRLLRAIDQNTLLSKLENDSVAPAYASMPSAESLMKLYAAFPELIYNTQSLLLRCTTLDWDLDSPKNRKSFTGNARDDADLLYKLAAEGGRRRYGLRFREVERRLAAELKVIVELGFSAYFLITCDMVRYAQSRGFRHVGRGSGANSLVAYCLQITDVDPLELDLYFERFINPYRSSPPDFDIDFSWKERDEVLDYLFKRYGSHHTALLATVSTFRGRSTIRELAKVFGLPKEEIDQLIRRNAPLPGDRIGQLIYRYAAMLDGLPNHLSIHAGGVIITEEPLSTYAACMLPPKGFPTVMMDMFVAEENGYFKYDVLSQRGLGHLSDAVQMIRENRGREVDLSQTETFKSDKQINDLLEQGDTIGCFYIESPAMRQLLRKLRCRDYLTLVAASSIIRPGVAGSGMMGEYIRRHHHPGSYSYLHPRLEELLRETHGVMVYQEDVIKVAHHFAGLDLGEADVLRRAMSGKFRSADGFAMIRNKFFAHCRARGYAEETTTELWRQMESFSGYSFSKAHSASFAVESYQSLFLRTYFPLEFMTAVLNNFGGFYSSELYFHEARRMGAVIEPPCLNRSLLLNRLKGNTIFAGFVHVDQLERAFVEQFLAERLTGGPYLGLADFCARLSPRPEQLQLLIRSGAFRFTGRSKKHLYWETGLMKQAVATAPKRQAALFASEDENWALPEFRDEEVEDYYDQLELLGFPLGDPFILLDREKAGSSLRPSAELFGKPAQQISIAAYYVASKHVRTLKGEHMQFGTFLDVAGRLFDTVHFPDSIRQYPMQGRGFYLLQGKLSEEYGVFTLEVSRMSKMAVLGDPRYV